MPGTSLLIYSYRQTDAILISLLKNFS